MTQYVYRFGGGVSDGGAGDRNLLGGKGANLAEMASIGLPVPPGLAPWPRNSWTRLSAIMTSPACWPLEKLPDSARLAL